MSRELALGRPGLRVRIIRKVRAYAGPADISQTHRYYAFTGLAELSSAWLRTTEGLGLGAAEACRTQCEIVDAMDRPLAYVAYNGRIFACSPQGRIDHGQVLYDPPRFRAGAR